MGTLMSGHGRRSPDPPVGTRELGRAATVPHMSTSTNPSAVRTGEIPERSIGQLVSDASTDVSSLLRSELELAKIEVASDVKNAGKGAGMFVAAGVLGLYAFGLLLLGAVWGLEALFGLPLWAGFLIVMGVLLIIAAILALVGKKNVSRVKGKPEKAIANAQQTVAAVKPAPKA